MSLSHEIVSSARSMKYKFIYYYMKYPFSPEDDYISKGPLNLVGRLDRFIVRANHDPRHSGLDHFISTSGQGPPEIAFQGLFIYYM